MSFKTQILAAVAFAALTVTAPSAFAQDEDLAISGNVSMVSDYRFRGVSISDEDIAVQGGIDLGYQGFYVGTWGSSIEQYAGAETKLNVYGGYVFALDSENDVALDLGVKGYVFPGGTSTDYYELTARLTGKVADLGLSADIAYAPDQDNIGNDDNLYLRAGASYMIPDSPITVVGSFGYEDGAFGNEKLDWKLGVEAEYRGLVFGLAYVDTDQAGDAADATAVFSIGAKF